MGSAAPSGVTGPLATSTGGLCSASGLTAPAVLGSGVITTVLGDGTYGYSGDGGPATSAATSEVYGFAISSAGDLVFGDRANSVVRAVDGNGVVTTIAGNGIATTSGDGALATLASIDGPSGVAVTPDGTLYVSDIYGNRIRSINTSGVISTAIGTGAGSSTGDGGPGVLAAVNRPHSMVVDPSGRLVWAEYGGNTVRRLESNGTVTRLAGSGVGSWSGDGGLATSGTIFHPYALVYDDVGNLYVSTEDNYIRKVTPAGIISTVAGTGVAAYAGEGVVALGAPLNFPTGLAWKNGVLYVSEFSGHRVRAISGGLLTTVGGNGVAGFAGDGGQVSVAQFSNPFDLGWTTDGALLVADRGNSRIRRINL
jgi:trimeric autotransporter adhesin